MVKLKAFIISIVLVLITLLILNETYIKKIDDYYKVKDNSIRYNTSYEKYKSYDILTQNIKQNTLVLLGSSELTATINQGYHPKKMFNYDDFNIMQIGEGHFQNIIHAKVAQDRYNDMVPLYRVPLATMLIDLQSHDLYHYKHDIPFLNLD